MKEYWKTHTIVPPCENDPLYIVGKIEEKMTENKTIITIERYNKKLTYYVPNDISVSSIMEYDLETNKVVDLTIEASGEGILFEIEEK